MGIQYSFCISQGESDGLDSFLDLPLPTNAALYRPLGNSATLPEVGGLANFLGLGGGSSKHGRASTGLRLSCWSHINLPNRPH